jgi:hypothetical protein
MKTNRFGYLFLVLSLAALACNSVSSLQPASLQTLQARTAVTQTAEVLGDLRLESGLVIGSPNTTKEFLQKNQNIQLLEGLAVEQYQPEELSQAGKTYTYTIKLDQEQPFLWGSNWCTTTDKLLRDNFKHISFEFSVEDTPIAPNQFLVWDNPLDDMQCRLYYTVLRGWPSGTTHLQIKITFDQAINDGKNDFPAGTHTYRYAVTLP